MSKKINEFVNKNSETIDGIAKAASSGVAIACYAMVSACLLANAAVWIAVWVMSK